MRRSLIYGLVMLLLDLAAPLSADEKTLSEPSPGSGVKVQFRTETPHHRSEILTGDSLKVRFDVADLESGKPLTGLRPTAWAMPRTPGSKRPDTKACEQQIAGLLRGGLATQNTVNFNGFQILTLNADSTIGILNPQVNVNSANLLGLIPFQGRAADWAFDERLGLAYITLPEQGRLAVVDVVAGALKSYIHLAKGVHHIVLQPASRRLWVGNDKTGSVSVIDSESARSVKTLKIGKGPIGIVFDDQGRHAFVTSGAAGQLAIVDTKTFKFKRPRQKLPATILHSAYSALADAVYVADANSGKIAAWYAESAKAAAPVESIGPGISHLIATPDGRYILALLPEQQQLAVIDTADNRLINKIATEAEPDHIVFSDSFAYLYYRGVPAVGLLPLAKLADTGTIPTHIPTGVEKPAIPSALPSLSNIAALPEGGGAMIVNPADMRIFFYSEGMMAPNNSLKLQTAPPLGMRIYNRGLKPDYARGSYATEARLEQPGIYDVAFFLDNPRTAVCFEVEVKPDPTRKAAEKPQPPALTSLFDKAFFAPGQPALLRFALQDPSSGAELDGLADVKVLSFQAGSNWQMRTSAASTGKKGIYEAKISYPKPGQYQVLIEIASKGVRYGDIPFALVQVVDPKLLSTPSSPEEQ